MFSGLKPKYETFYISIGIFLLFQFNDDDDASKKIYSVNFLANDQIKKKAPVEREESQPVSIDNVSPAKSMLFSDALYRLSGKPPHGIVSGATVTISRA